MSGVKWGANYIPITKEVERELKEQIVDEIHRESPLLALLDKKVKEAEKEMTKQLNDQLWGIKPYSSKSLRGIISDAYDEHMPKEKEKKMSEAVDKVKAEREEAKARAVFDALDGIFDDLDYTGATVTWEVQFDVDGKVYTYAAILSGDGCWWVTGKDTTGRKTEEFKAYIAEKALKAHRVEFRGTVL